jgi:Xaa-Pro aminopeptidase
MKRQTQLSELKKLMVDQGLNAYIIPASDPHQNEYIPPCWQYRSWLSGFTGSAGTIVITSEVVGLWTDSRYFIQAEKQILGSGIELFKLKTPHTPEHIPWLASNLPANSKIGIDDRFFSLSMVQYIQETLIPAGHELITGVDLLNTIWNDRPSMPTNPVFIHEIEFAGLSRKDKIKSVGEELKKFGAEHHLITTLDDIAWLLNLRGHDVSFCPFFISFCIVSSNQSILFINQEKVSDEIVDSLAKDHVVVQPYESITNYLKSLPENSSIYYSPEKVNHALIKSIPSDVRHIRGMNITTGLKSIKNSTEIDGLKKVMVKDGIAWAKTLYWIKNQQDAGNTLSEWSIAQKIASFRSEQSDYQGESFHPISSYGWHGAIVHYSVTPEESLYLEADGIYLLDSGGHYKDGTTDTTRTIALSDPDEMQKSDFTRALKGTLGVSMLRFPKGTKGFQIDVLARKSLWDAGLNYGHGTGHGVGFFLSVHEGPQTIGTSASGFMNVPLEPGMITTVEPAIYREGHYGMRTENMTIVIQDIENEYGSFYRFETLTIAPIDRKLIDKSLLTQEELDWLNSYHQKVYNCLVGHLTAEEQIWLKEATNKL